MDKMKIDDEVSVGGQPTEADLKELQELGFKSVVNLRTDNEEDQPLSPDEEGSKVHELEMDYLHVPISMESVGSSQIEHFREHYQKLRMPVYVHCATGKRAGAMVMMDQAVKNRMTGDETLKQAEAMGFECDSPQLKQLVTSYVDCKLAESK